MLQLFSCFVDELSIAYVDAASEIGYYGGGSGMQSTAVSCWDDLGMSVFQVGSYDSFGWKRVQERISGFGERGGSWCGAQGVRLGLFACLALIEGEGCLVVVLALTNSVYARGDWVFHVKFGYGKVMGIEGNKLIVAFDKVGEKKVIDSFVEKV